MNYSVWGSRILSDSGITTLMRDLSTADASAHMLGGGSPARIPAVERFVSAQMRQLMERDGEFEAFVSNYAGPQGSTRFAGALADMFRTRYGWNVHAGNIMITNGSQMAFSLLFRLLAGDYPDGGARQVLLPISPEYIGYSDIGEPCPLFRSMLPHIMETGERGFKYQVDFDRIEITPETSAICVSRPTNPTGNVLTDDEMEKLSALAERHGIPFIIDGAYGLPFPGIVYADAKPFWNENVILVLSLSKLGLPGARTGIVVASDEIVHALACVNAVTTLATNKFGPFLMLEAVRNGDILELGETVIRPHYEAAAKFAIDCVQEQFSETPYRLHQVEGAFFIWLWFPNLPITSLELYGRLKERGVIVVPGNFFFPGLQEDWRHRDECIRVSYAASRDSVAAGLAIIADEVKKAYHETAEAVSFG